MLGQFTWNTIYGQVFVHQVEEAGLDLLEKLFTELADKAIIVIGAHMHNELFVALLCALRDGHHISERNLTLEGYVKRDKMFRLVLESSCFLLTYFGP